MKKAFILFFILLGIISCSDDETPLVEKVLLVKEINDEETEEYFKYFYNPDSTLQKVEVYDDGLLTELQVSYQDGTRWVDAITTYVEEWDEEFLLKFVYTENHQLDSANYYSSEEPGLKTGGLVYTYDNEGRIENIRYWNIYEELYDYPIEVNNNNITAYEDPIFETQLELKYSDVMNPVYPFGIYLHAAVFDTWDLAFENFLSKNKPNGKEYIINSEKFPEKISLKRNENNYPVREKHTALDTLMNDIRFTYYE
jgi:hypothetical protein